MIFLLCVPPVAKLQQHSGHREMTNPDWTVTFFNVQDLTGIELNLHFPIGLIFAEPAVAREHVLHPMNGHGDLDTVQKPPSPQALVTVTDQETVYLETRRTLENKV